MSSQSVYKRGLPLLAALLSTGVLAAPALATAAPDTAASPPDAPASVNATPDGVWSTSAVASAHGSSSVGPADSQGCPSGYGCGWVNNLFGGMMGKWAGKNPNLAAFSQGQCSSGNWNDCISSTDNNGTSGCNLNWTWDITYRGNIYTVPDGTADGRIGSNSDQFSSDYWCST